MKNKLFKWLSGTIVCATIAACFSACADDHFDITSDAQGRKTLWENISSNTDLSEFADLLQRVKYSKSEGITTIETYADLFNGNQTFTVWAPKNGTFGYEKYDALLKTGKASDAYKVETELIRNSMTRFGHVMMGNDSLRILLFNGKNAVLNSSKSLVKNQRIIVPNIGSKNGVLHVVDGAIEFQPNIYEYMSTRSDLDSVSAFIKGFQKMEFSEALSTQGPTVNGYITWVDSVFQMTNKYFSYIGTDLTREDSAYAMILPTNDAWDVAVEKAKSYYNYKLNYKQTVATTTPEGNDTVISGVETVFSQEELDSIVNFRTKNAIAKNLVFNMNSQWGRNYTQFGVEGECDSLITTSGTKFFDPYSAQLFNGASPIEVSNGYAFVVDKFNYRAIDSWAEEKILEVEHDAYLESATSATVPNRKYSSIISSLYDEDGNVKKDTTVKYTALVLSPKAATSQPEATFILRDILSCKYDIFVVMAYNYADNKPNRFQVSLAYDEPTKRVANQRLKNPDEGDAENYNTTYFVNNQPYWDENDEYHYVDSVLVAKDFEFPICYEGLTDAYVALTIKSNFKSGEKHLYSRELLIDKIILRAKE